MKPNFLISLLLLTLTACSGNNDSEDPLDFSDSETVSVQISTSMGKFVIVLDLLNAPNTSANFIQYVNDGFYDGKDENGKTTFHRVIDDFMIQGGGYTVNGTEKSTYAPIENESIESALSNVRGSVAMARTGDPHSATSQFFVNTLDNRFLDAGESISSEYGYAVFGYVDKGMEVVDAISEVDVDNDDKPLEDITIDDISFVDFY